MNKFYAQDGQFWIDDQPLLVQAGEFHYFRTPKDQWRHRLSLMQAAGFNAMATYIPWLWHQLDEDVSDFDGHSHPMRDLAGFLDLAAEMGFWIIPRPGPYIMAETINEGIPPWVFKKYPQAAFISQDQKIQNVVSYMHPDYLACVKKWYRAVFAVLAPRQITRGGKIILVQLDNEMGMIQWVRNIMDINPDTLSRFAIYVRKTYGPQLLDRYPAGQLEDFFKEGISTPNKAYGGKIVEDYRQFYRDYLREYASFLWSEAKLNGLEVSPVINIHGFANGGKTFPIGISQLLAVMRLEGMISATDVYPIFIVEGNFHQLLMVNEMTKALHNKQQPLFSIEFQAGGVDDFSNGQASLFDLHTRLSVSSGMRAINHYLFCDGENDPILSPVKRHDWGHAVRKDGTLRRHYHRYPKLSKVLASYGTDLVMTQPEPVTTIGFSIDDFMTEVNNEYTKKDTDIITHQREVILFDMIARGLSLTHRAFNTVELRSSDLDPAQTPTLWVMMDKRCNAATQQKLVDYVLEGGRLILAGRMCVEDSNQKPCTILKDTVGIKQTHSDPPFSQNFIQAFQYVDIPVSFLETYSGDFDGVFARRGNGEVAGFIKILGKGKILMLGAALAANTLDDLDIVRQVATLMDCPSPFKLSDWADVRFNRGQNGNFLYVNNYQDDPVETTVEYQGELLFGGKPLLLPARRGLILPLEWRLRDDVMIHYVTSEIVEITEDGTGILLRTEQNEFTAELTLAGYTCERAMPVKTSGRTQRVKVEGKDGVIVIRRVRLG